MVAFDWKKRPQKRDARLYAMMGLTGKKYTLWLPGEQCVCVKQALEMKPPVVNSDGHFVFVERDADCIPGIKRFVKSREWQHPPVLHADYLDSLVLPFKLDYAFLDFLGNLNKKTCHWMSSEMSSKLRVRADVSITLSYAWRTNNFLYDLKNSLEDLPAYFELQRQMRIFNDYITVPAALLQMIFHQWTFDWGWPMLYRDSTRSMLTLRLGNFQRRTNGWPALKDYEESAVASTLAVVSPPVKELSPAQKAWATRRKK